MTRRLSIIPLVLLAGCAGMDPGAFFESTTSPQTSATLRDQRLAREQTDALRQTLISLHPDRAGQYAAMTPAQLRGEYQAELIRRNTPSPTTQAVASP